MGMVVRTNTMAINANRQLGMNNNQVAKSLEKLSSGFRINRAGDDASGLAISEKMKAQIKGLEQASANAQDGISLIQTAEGNLAEVHDMLNRMVELAEKSANGILEAEDRASLQEEMNALANEIDRIADSANFNNIKLFDGSLTQTAAGGGAGAGAGAGGAAGAGGTGGTPAPASLGRAGGTGVTLSGLDTTKSTTGVSAVTITPGTATIPDGDIKIKTVDKPAAKGEGGDDTFKGTTGTTTDVLNGYTIKFDSTGGSAGITVSDKTITIDLTGKTITDMASIKTQVAAVAGDTSSDPVKAAVAAIDWTGSASLTNGITDLNSKQVTIANGNADNSTTITVTDKNDTTIAEGTLKDTEVTGEIKLTNATTGAEVKLTVETASKLTDGIATATTLGTYTAPTSPSPTNPPTETTPPTVTNPTATTATVTDGDSTKAATIQFKLDGMKLDKGGKATFDIAGKSYVIDVPEADKTDVTKIGDLLVAAINKDKPTDTDAGAFTAINTTGTITLTATNKAAIKDTAIKNVTSFTVKGGDTTQQQQPPASSGGLKLQIGDSNYDYDKLVVSMDNMHMVNLFDDEALKDGSYGTNKLGQADAIIGQGPNDFTKPDGTAPETPVTGTTVGANALNISTQDNAGAALKAVRKVITKVSTQRGKLGAIQNRLEHTINNLDTAYENMTAANSRIRDTDMAKEMMNYTKMNVLVQSAQAMLAQANQQPQSILQLLQ